MLFCCSIWTKFSHLYHFTFSIQKIWNTSVNCIRFSFEQQKNRRKKFNFKILAFNSHSPFDSSSSDCCRRSFRLDSFGDVRPALPFSLLQLSSSYGRNRTLFFFSLITLLLLCRLIWLLLFVACNFVVMALPNVLLKMFVIENAIDDVFGVCCLAVANFSIFDLSSCFSCLIFELFNSNDDGAVVHCSMPLHICSVVDGDAVTGGAIDISCSIVKLYLCVQREKRKNTQ